MPLAAAPQAALPGDFAQCSAVFGHANPVVEASAEFNQHP
jgi:hypothetical protein